MMKLLSQLWCSIAHRGDVADARFYVLGEPDKGKQCLRCGRMWVEGGR